MRKILFSLYSVVGAYTCLSLLIYCIWRVWLVPSVDISDLVNLSILTIAPPLISFFLGAFLGAGLVWLLPGRLVDCSPMKLATGAFVGALMGVIVACLSIGVYIIIDPYAIDSTAERFGGKVAVTSNNIWNIIILGSAFFSLLFARFSARHLKEKPQTITKRSVYFFSITVLFGAALIGMFKLSDFPGSDATLERRHEWSKKNAGSGYSDAISYVKKSNVIMESIGKVQAVAPVNQLGASRSPYMFFLQKKSSSRFILEVLGESGEGYASLKVRPSESGRKNAVFGSFTVGSHTVELPKSFL